MVSLINKALYVIHLLKIHVGSCHYIPQMFAHDKFLKVINPLKNPLINFTDDLNGHGYSCLPDLFSERPMARTNQDKAGDADNKNNRKETEEKFI